MLEHNRHERPQAIALRRRGFNEEQIAEALAATGGNPLLDSNGTRKYLGNVSEMTLWRWGELLGFPGADFVIGRRRFWRLSTIEGWLAQQQAPPDAA
jgi:hypothetical protein